MTRKSFFLPLINECVPKIVDHHEIKKTLTVKMYINVNVGISRLMIV